PGGNLGFKELYFFFSGREPVKHRPRNGIKALRAGQRLENFGTFLVVRLQKSREVVLCKQNSSFELFKRKPDFCRNRRKHFALLPPLLDHARRVGSDVSAKER